MNFLDGILADLRERGLAPVAIALAVAVLAVPVLLHKSADGVEVADPSTATAPGAEPDRPLVALAALRTVSDLDTFDTKNPFRSLRPVAELSSTDVVAPALSSGGAPSSVSGGGAGTGADGISSFGGAPASPAPVSPVGPTAGGGDTPSDASDPDGTTNGETGHQPAGKAQFTHRIDVAYARNDRARTFRGVERLETLPSTSNPFLVFLGVDPAATTAMFLVDGVARQSGEGECIPSAEDCRFLNLKIDDSQDEHLLLDDVGNEYYFRLRDIRRVLIDPAAAAAALDSFPQLVDVEEVSVTATPAPAPSNSSR